MSDIQIFDTIAAWQVEVGDQVVIDGELIEVSAVEETDDIDEIVISGYSNDTGDFAHYSVCYDEELEMWGV